jgi:NADPH:quinone reductase-like Zn-dependent oxidoreductase
MKAMVYDSYGSPEELELQQIDVPRAHDDQVLVRVRAASVNRLDWHFLTGRPFMARIMAGGLLRPRHKVLGVDLAGQVQKARDLVLAPSVDDLWVTERQP